MTREQLKAWMEHNEINTLRMAVIMGISRSWVYAWLNGSRPIPSWLYLTLPTIENIIKERKPLK